MARSFTAIAALHAGDPAGRYACSAERCLFWPDDESGQLFHEPHAEPLFATVIGAIGWRPARWRLAELSGAALAEVCVPREDEAADPAPVMTRCDRSGAGRSDSRIANRFDRAA